MPDPLQLPHDGTSQAERRQPALAPGYVSVDERSVQDLLAFVRAYAQELRWFDASNAPDGDWSGLLPDDLDLDEAAAWLDEACAAATPDEVSRPDDPRLGRPHVVLLLTFLQLYRRVQARMNGLTGRHLDFYYREVLRLVPRAGRPDRVAVLFELEEDQPELLIPAGTLLVAGQDAQGEDLHYRTVEDLVANQGQVASLKSVFVQTTVIGLDEVRRDPTIPTAEKRFVAMLRLALGEPGPGGELPPYPAGAGATRPVNEALFKELDALLAGIPADTFLSLPAFRGLMELKARLDPKANPGRAGDWGRINERLKAAGKAKAKGAEVNLPVKEPRTIADFLANLNAALGLGERSYDGLPEVKDVFALERHLQATGRADLAEFVRTGLAMSVAEFQEMMGTVNDIYADWRRVSDLLRAAGRRKQQADSRHQVAPVDLRAAPAGGADKFGELVAASLKPPPPSLDERYEQLVRLERYFFLRAEEYALVRRVFLREVSGPGNERPAAWEWAQAYGLWQQALIAKSRAGRGNELRRVREAQGFDAMMRLAFDPWRLSRPFLALDPTSPADAADIQDKLLLDAGSATFLQRLARQGVPEGPEARAKFAADWEDAYRIVEQGQRQARGLADPRPEVERWDNVYAAEDATQVQVRTGVAGDDTTPRWRTFGEGWQADGTGRTTPAAVGFAVASPLLALAEGVRTVQLTLWFAKEGFDRAAVEQALAPYQLTGAALVALGGLGVPAEVVSKLNTVQDKVYAKREDFLTEVQRALGPDERARYLELLISQAQTLPFRVLVSTAEGMVEVAGKPRVRLAEDAEIKDVPGGANVVGGGLRVVLTLDAQAPPVVPPPAGAGPASPWPVLQVLLKDMDDGATPSGPVKRYGPFRDLALERVELRVQAQGLTTLAAQTDAGTADPTQPFEPFGTVPVEGARLRLANAEICSKRLDELVLELDWLGAPEDFSDYYKGYAYQTYYEKKSQAKSPVSSNGAFQARLKLYDNRAAFDLADVPLFRARDAGNPKGASRAQQVRIDCQETVTKAYRAYGALPGLTTGATVQEWSRYWILELGAQDFLHGVYPQAAALAASAQSDDAQPKPAPVVLKPPYTPKLKRLGVSYTASAVLAPGRDEGQADGRLYHVEPFGWAPVRGGPGQPCRLLPRLEHAGTLYVGVAGLKPPQDLALLFQVAAGSADPDLTPEPVSWSYLSDDRWVSLEQGGVVADGTDGLQQAGIVTLRLPATEPSTRLPAGLAWLRAAVAKNGRAVGDLVAVRAQAAAATFADAARAPERLGQTLPPGTIAALASPLVGIKGVRQPFSSYGGDGPEPPEEFATRVSERLRHKDRALTRWDCERLVLEAFPEVYKVKCLPAGSSADPRLADCVQLVVIPDVRGRVPFDPFQPKLPAGRLEKIERYLRARAPAGVRLVVKNPRYVPLQVRFSVRFRPGYNPEYCRKQLNEDLQRFLSPWAYDQGADVVLGGRVCAALIVDYVERRPYVDYLTGMKLFAGPEGQGVRVDEEVAEGPGIAGGEPDVVLVSAREHQIDAIGEKTYADERFVGINYMKVGLDFQVA